MTRGCDALARLRSGLVDGSLAPADRERVVSHLLGCAACRRDVAELRAVRELLGRSPRDPGPAPDLSTRLVSIAGVESTEPLWTRPFRRTRAGSLPSQRRRAQLKGAAGAVSALVAVAVVGFIGWSAAPGGELAAVADPVDDARAELDAAVGQLTLAGPSLGALLMLDALPAATTQGWATNRPATGTGLALSATGARQTLARAVAANGTVPLTGRQAVLVSSDGRSAAATVAVDARQGSGTQLSLLAADDHVLATTRAPAPADADPQQEVLDVLGRTYAFTGHRGGTVAGRRATVVEARRDGRVSKRWWVDDASGVLLWQESYDRDGRPTVSTGFTELHLHATGAQALPRPAHTQTAGLRTALATSSASWLATSGWACADQLAGLPMLQLSTDSYDDPRVVHVVYGDGLSTVSVLQQRGDLASPPAGATWDAGLRAWRHAGPVPWTTWESGGTVLTVTTDGPASVLEAATASLPRRDPVSTTTLGRVREGWSKILADSKG